MEFKVGQLWMWISRVDNRRNPNLILDIYDDHVNVLIIEKFDDERCKVVTTAFPSKMLSEWYRDGYYILISEGEES